MAGMAAGLLAQVVVLQIFPLLGEVQPIFELVEPRLPTEKQSAAAAAEQAEKIARHKPAAGVDTLAV